MHCEIQYEKTQGFVHTVYLTGTIFAYIWKSYKIIEAGFVWIEVKWAIGNTMSACLHSNSNNGLIHSVVAARAPIRLHRLLWQQKKVFCLLLLLFIFFFSSIFRERYKYRQNAQKKMWRRRKKIWRLFNYSKLCVTHRDRHAPSAMNTSQKNEYIKMCINMTNKKRLTYRKMTKKNCDWITEFKSIK